MSASRYTRPAICVLLLGFAFGALGLPPECCSRAVFAEEPEITFDAVPPEKWTGEPYELAGSRLVFTIDLCKS